MSRRDYRPAGIVITLVSVSALGYLLATLPPPHPEPVTPAGQSEKSVAIQHVEEARQREIDTRFQQAVAMLHAKEYDYALKALHRVLDLSPQMPEAHVNMGFALFGLERFEAARDFFYSAIELRPEQANAYFGLAISLERLGDLEGALGAMRTYLHRSKEDGAYQRRARAAIWEWEALLKQQRVTSRN